MTSRRHARTHRSRLRASDVARLGLTGLRARPMRAVLSALGIAIGIAAMVGVVGVSASSQARLQEQLRALGTNMLTARSGADLSGADLILPEDSVGRVRMIPGVTDAASTSTLSGVSVYRSRLSDPNATGGIITMAADTNLLKVVSGTMKKGAWLNDATAKYPGVVLGSKAAQLLGVVEPGTQVWLGGMSFTWPRNSITRPSSVFPPRARTSTRARLPRRSTSAPPRTRWRPSASSSDPRSPRRVPPA